jgi:hypothetical protein
VRAQWPVVHRCGHRVLWDLSRKHPDDRAGFARWLALRDCTPCWWTKRRHHGRSPAERRRQLEYSRITRWERATSMPLLAGSNKAVAWAAKIRHRLITAALPTSEPASGCTDAAVTAVIGAARAVTAAAWWIDHRKVEPRDLPALLATAGTPVSNRGSRRR